MTLATYPNVISNGLRWFRNPYAFLDDAQAQHGPTFRVALPGLGRPLLTGDPQLIREIVANKDLVGGKGIHIMRALFGSESLIMLQGETHQQHRRIVAASFRPVNIARYDELTLQTGLEVMQNIPFDQPFSMFEVVREITQIVIIRFVFGRLPPEQEAEGSALLTDFMTSFDNPLILFLKPLHVDLGARSPWGRAMRNRTRLQNFIFQRVRNFRQTPANRHSVLAHILGYGELSESEVVSELSSLLMFGHDTTSVTLSWAFAHIYSHPEAVTRIRQEAFVDQEGESGVSFLKACINESMRLSPIVVQLFRISEKDGRIDRHPIRKNEMVMPCPYLAHHNPLVFPEPQCFMPERFMKGDVYPNSFFPYGFGTRLCVGRPLAQQQMPLILSTAIKHMNFSLVSNDCPLPVRYMFFMAPQHGTLMVRKDQPALKD